MKASGGAEAAKRRAGRHAAEGVDDGSVVGLGTGSTAAHAIRALGDAVDAGLEVTGVATSYQARETAREAGVPLTGLEDVERLDVAIDGADQVAGAALLKGGGAAHAREKVVAAAADRFVVVVDESKLVGAIDGPVPVEVLPAARTVVAARIAADLGAEVDLRWATDKDGPVVTDNGNLVLDCDFGEIDDPAGLGEALDRLPGSVEHGLFVGLADEIHVGTGSGVEVR